MLRESVDLSHRYPKHPGKVLASAQYAGLSAIVRLAKRRVTRDETVQRMFAGIDKMWRNARAQVKSSSISSLRNLTPFFNAEPNMRKNFLGMHWHSTKPYGNKEFKRVYRWSEGTIGPLNELYNFAGAQLRTLAMTQFPFTNPTYYQIREYTDGTTKTLSKSTAIKYLEDEGVYTHWIALYPGNNKHPEVRVRHPTLPELDFVDMIRAHVYELCRQCFIHNVPRDAAYRYIRLLIHHLTPFLEWKYTEGVSGRKNFWPQADRELRKIVLELRAVHSRRCGRTPRLTQQLTDKRPEKITINILKDQAKKALAKNKTLKMKRTVTTLRKHIAKKYIKDNDVTSLVDDALRISGIEGNRWHTVISNNGYQPNSLSEVVFHGDKHHRELNDVLVAHEVPVTTPKGLGVADIVVFVRRVFGERVIWTPVMVLDHKTKTQLDWTFFSKKPRTKKDETRVFVHDINKRSLSDDEWKSVLDCTPSRTNMSQLTEYEKGIIGGFAEIVHDKEIIPKSLWKGIVVLDTEESYKDIIEILPWLIKGTLSNLETSTDDANSRTLYELESSNDSSQSLKLALMLSSKKGPFELLEDRKPLTELVIENPFERRVKDERNFTLYLSVACSGSSGDSAAWTARNWHLLEYLRQLFNQDPDSRIVWLDLMGFYPSTELAISRLRITGKLSPKGMKREILYGLRSLVRRIDFVNLNDELKSYFFEETRAALKRIQDTLNRTFEDVGKKQIVIVDGWSELRKITPSRLDSLMKTLERKLLEWLPKKNVEIIWLDKPVPLPTRSFIYQRPEVSPLPHDSPRRAHLDLIIWNKPTPPRFPGWKSPVLEYVRVIEQDTPTETEPFSSLFLVPHLHGWGRRFRADSSEGRSLTESDVMELVHGTKYARGTASTADYTFAFNDSTFQDEMLLESLKLSPSILRPRKEGDRRHSVLIKPSSIQDSMPSANKMDKARSFQGILDRLTLVPSETLPIRSRWSDDESRQYYPADEITRARIHKKKREPEKRNQWTRRPPLLKAALHEVMTGAEAYRQETLRILRTAKFLRSGSSSTKQDWRRFLSDIIKECENGLKTRGGTKKPIDVLEDVKNILKLDKESKDIWKLLSYTRKESAKNASISTDTKDAHIQSSDKDSELWELFGNDLYLLILAISWDDNREVNKSDLEILWSAFSDWQLVHMGFVPCDQSTNQVKSKYDISSIWSNLRWRAKQLAHIAQPSVIFEGHRFGLLVQVDHNRHWFIFQDRAGCVPMIAGLTEVIEGPLRWKWYGCILDPFEIESWIDKSWDHSTPVVISSIERKDILWTPRMDDDEIVDWWAEGVLEYSQPQKGRNTPMRWFRLSRIPDSLRTRLVQPEVNIPDELEYAVKHTLEQLEGFSENIREVECKVAIDTSKEVYVIQFFDPKNKSKVPEPVCILEIRNISDLIQTLRYPRVIGTPFRGEYWWNPEVDINYTQIESESGSINMTFLKPFIYRNRKGSAFLRTITLPRTAKDVMRTELGDSITLVADPNLKMMKHPFTKYWRVLFLQTELSERMLALQSIDVNIFEVAQFFECEQFIDTETGLRHPVKIAINNAKHVNFPKAVFQYNRIAIYLKERGILVDSENDFEYSG